MICDFSFFLETYGLSTLIIAVAVMVISFLCDIFFSNKIPTLLSNGLPFIVGVVLSTLYAFIFGGETELLKPISSGLVASSLGLAFKAFIRKLKSGKAETDLLILCISELILDFCDGDAFAVARSIASIIRSNGFSNQETLEKDVDDVLKKCGIDSDGLCQTIINSAKNLINH
ncbi:MAG: hypothetical protein IJY57_05185 [Clostridia bacterium]|nr:hypothetical protein [Clostridia bacterium]